MTCEAIQNRLLDLPDLHAVPADLLAHTAGCDRCVRFLEKARALALDLAALPAPSGESAKLAFLDGLLAAGPVIRTVPAANATGSISLRDLLRRIPVRPVAAAAAATLVGFGIWTAIPGPRPPVAKVPPPRHELLQKVVHFNTELAALAEPKDRVVKLAGLAADLRGETRALSKTAQKVEMLSLARMYETVVEKGIVSQSEKMTLFNTPVAERQAAIKTAMAELARASAEVTALVPTASQQVQPLLRRIAKTARDGEARLLQLANGEA